MVKLVAKHQINYQEAAGKPVKVAKVGETFSVPDGPAAVLLKGNSAVLAEGETAPNAQKAADHEQKVADDQAKAQEEARQKQIEATQKAATAVAGAGSELLP